MNKLPEIMRVAFAGLGAKKARTALIALGPMLGVAAIVGAVGMSSSAKGDLQAMLSELGTNLVVVEASDTVGGQGGQPTLPEEAQARALLLPSVEAVAPVVELSDITVTPTEVSEEYFQTLPAGTRVADASLPDVLDIELRAGRWLNDADETTESRSAVIGNELASEFQYLNNEIRHIRLNEIDYAVVGVLETIDLVPSANNSVYITSQSAENDFGSELAPTTMYVRAEEGMTAEAEETLPVGIALGGPETVTTTVPSSLLEAEAQVDKTLQAVVIAMGGLALIVGGVGIANVMSISVIQRSSEIGIRRAIGHTRGTIATQFLIEAFLVGVVGGVAGATVGGGLVYFGAQAQGWTLALSPALLVWACALAVAVATVAGIYPSTKAAKMEPLETLRLG